MLRSVLAVFLVLSAAVVAQNGNNTAVSAEEMESARICSAGKSCVFNVDVVINMTDKAVSAKGNAKPGEENIHFELVVEISAACDSASNRDLQYFRGLITDVPGGNNPAGDKLREYPFFFIQNKVTGEIKGVYTSNNDVKPAVNMKRGLVAALSKKFNKKVAEQVKQMLEAAKQSQGTSDLQMPEPVSYHFYGEDITGPFEAIHDIEATEDGGFMLTETAQYATEQTKSVDRGESTPVKKIMQAKTKVDKKGRVVSIKEEDKVAIGTTKPATHKPIISTPDTGEVDFKMNFNVERVDKEDVAVCHNPSMTVEDFETNINLELHGAMHRRLDKALSQKEMEYDELDGLDSKLLLDHIKSILPTADIGELGRFLRPSNVGPIMDIAWSQLRTGAISKAQMKKILAAVGDVRCPESVDSLIELMADKGADAELRSQAIISLHTLAGETSTPVGEHVLKTVSDLAFSDRDPFADDATLLLGTLCESNPAGAGYLRDMRDLAKHEGDPHRLKVLESALRNGVASFGNEDTLPEDEYLGVDELADLDLDTDVVEDLDMGLIGTGSHTFIDKNPKIAGNNNFNVKGRALAKADWGFEQAKVVGSFGLDATIFKKSNTVIGADFDATAQGNTLDAGYSFTIAGKVVKQDRKSYSNKFLRYGGSCPTALTDAPVAKTDDWDRKLMDFTFRFVLIIVPCKVSVSVHGAVGYSLHVGGWFNCEGSNGADIAVLGGVAPRGRMILVLTAAADILIASAGVTGNINIFEGKLPIYGELNKDKGCGKVDLEMSALSGKVMIFAQTGFGKKKSEETEFLQVGEDANEDVDEGVSELLQPTEYVDATTNQRFFRRIARGISRAVRAVGKVVVKGLKAIANALSQRFEKELISWEGPKVNKNLFQTCAKLNIGKFFKGSGDSKAAISSEDQAAVDQLTSEAAAAKKEAEATKKLAEESIKEAAASSEAATAAANAVSKTVSEESQRTVDAVRSNGARGRKQARSSARSTRQDVRKGADANENAIEKGADANQNAVQQEGQRTRDTTRAEGRQVDETVQKTEQSESDLTRRTEERVEQAENSNRRAQRRETGEVASELQNLASEQQQQSIEDTIRRQGKESRQQTESIQKQLARKEQRSEFRELKSEEAADAAQVSKLMRREDEKNEESANFQALRDQMRRKMDGIQEKSQFNEIKSLDRRLNNNENEEAKKFDSIKSEMDQNARQDSERRLMRREEKRISKAASNRNKINKEISSLGSKFKSMAKGVRKQTRRDFKKVSKQMQRSEDAAQQERQTEGIENTIKATEDSAQQRNEMNQLDSNIKKGFRASRKAVRQGRAEMQQTLQNTEQQQQEQQQTDDLKQAIESSNEGVQQTVENNSQQVRDQLQRQQTQDETNQAMGSIENKVEDLGQEAAKSGDETQSEIASTGDKMQSEANDLGEKANELGQQLGDKVKSGINGLGQKLRGKLGGLSNKISDSLNSIGAGGEGGLAGKLSGLGEKLGGDLGSKVEGLADKFGGQVGDKLQGLGGNLGAKIGDRLGGGLNRLGDRLGGKLGGKLKGLGAGLGSKLQGLGSKFGGQLGDKVRGLAGRLGGQLGGKLRGLGGKLGGKIGGRLEGLKNKFQGRLQGLGGKIGGRLQGLGKKLTARIGGIARRW